MSLVMAIDPGPTKSAWLYYDTDLGHPSYGMFGIDANEELLTNCRAVNVDAVVIEKVESFGMAVGAEVFETVYWSGRFAEAVQSRGTRVFRWGRKAIKIHLCGSMRAKDANIRAALIDRFGGSAAIGKKAAPGPLHGISGDVWSALAVAVTWADQHVAPPIPDRGLIGEVTGV